MAEIHPLWLPCRACGVESRRARPLVEVREDKERRAGFDQRLVFAGHRQRRRRQFEPVVEQDEAGHVRQPGRQRLDQRQEIDIEKHSRCAGFLQCVEQLLRRQGDVRRLQHSAHHWDREVAFMVAVGVPLQHRNDVAGLDAKIGQRTGQAPQSMAELPVGMPVLAIDDNLVGRAGQRRVQQMLDEQGIIVS